MSSFCKCKSYSHFSSKNNSVCAIFNDQSLNDTVTNDIVSFEQLGPVCQKLYKIFLRVQVIAIYFRKGLANSQTEDRALFENRAFGRSTSLRKHAYSNILKILPPKNENFQIKRNDIFHISAQNIDCGYSLEPPRRGGSNEYPQSMFLSRNKENNISPCKPHFYYIKVGFKGVKIT